MTFAPIIGECPVCHRSSEEFLIRPAGEADRIATLEAKVRELEAELQNLTLADLPIAMRDGISHLQSECESMQTELTASRQQVERLVEALKDLRSIVRHFWNDDHPEIFALDAACEKADEALAAVEKERGNRLS